MAPKWLSNLRHRVFGSSNGRTTGRYKGQRRTPAFEVLEDRTVPAIVALGTTLAFDGDFSLDPNTNTWSATSTPGDLIEIGLQSGSDIIPLISVADGGSVSFIDPTLGSNADLDFLVNGDLATFQVGSGPTVSLFEGLSAVTVSGTELTTTGSAAGVAPGPDIIEQVVGPGASLAFNPTKMFFADASLTQGDAEVWVQGTVDIGVLGVTGSVETSVAGTPVYVEIDQGEVSGFAATLNENIVLGSVAFDVQGLTVSYTTSDDTLTITGDTSFTLEGSTVNVNWSGGATSGLVVENGELQSLDMVVTADIKNLLGIDIGIPSSNPITVIYSADSGGTFTMTGDLKLSTTDSNILDVDASFSTDPGLPGLKIVDGAVSDVNVTINSDISLFGITLTVDNVNFQYQGSDSNGAQVFEILGGSATLKTTDFTVASAFSDDPSLPGLKVSDGAVSDVNVTINSDISLFGITLTVDNVNFQYQGQDANNHQVFEILGGSATLKTTDFTVGAAFSADTALPGLKVSDGAVSDVNVTINSDISLFGITLTVDNVNFQYQGSDSNGAQVFEILGGSATLKTTDFTVGAAFSADTALPGLKVSDGAVSDVNVTINSDISLFGITLTVDNVNFQYQGSDSNGAQVFEILGGSATLKTTDFTVASAFSDDPSLPGLKVSDGAVSDVNVTINSDISLFGITLTVDNVNFQYQGSDSNGAQVFEILGGSATLKTTDFTVGAAFSADTALPGLKVSDGAVSDVNVTINSDISLFGITLTVDSVNFQYQGQDANNHQVFEILGGSATLKTTDFTVASAFSADTTLPGLKVSDGAVSDVNVTINSDISLFGITLTVDNVNFQYVGSNDTFEILGGSVEVSTDSGDVLKDTKATFSDSMDSPGLKIVSGTVMSIDVTVSADFDLFGVEITPKDVHLQYSGTTSILQITTIESPGITVKTDAFEATADLPDGGILINTSTGAVTVDGLVITLSDVNLGAFTIKELQISYTQVGGNTDFDVTLALAFPQNWAVQGEMQLINNKVNEVSLDVSGLNIPIGDTGLFLTEIDATVQNIAKPSNLTVSGDIFVRYGDSVTMFGETVSIFSAKGSFFVDKDELKLDADVYLGSITDSHGTPSTTGILGTGHGQVLLDWAAGDYSLDVSASLLDGVYTFDADVSFDSRGELTLLAEADVNVPHGIPFIGGKRLGSLDFLLKFDPKANPSDNFVAAWTKVNLVFKKVEIGFQYDFEDNKAKVIGAGTINADLRSQSEDPSKPYTYSQTFTVPSTGATQATLTADWSRAFPEGTTLTNPTVTVTGTTSGGTVVLQQITENAFSEANGLSLLPQTADTLSKQVGVVGNSSNDLVPLNVGPNGTYTLQFSVTSNLAPRTDTAPVTSITSFENPDGSKSTMLTLDGLPSDLRVGDTITVSGSSVGPYNTNHTVVEITSSGQVVTDQPYAGDENPSHATIKNWYVPQFQSTFHIPPTVFADTDPIKIANSNNVAMNISIAGIPTLQNNTTVDLYIDQYNDAVQTQDFNGLLIAKNLKLDGSASGNSLTPVNRTASTQIDLNRLDPRFTYYLYAVVNDGTNPAATSPASSPFSVDLSAVAVSGNVTSVMPGGGAGVDLNGWTVFVDENGNGVIDPGELSTTTNSAGYYTFLRTQTEQLPIASIGQGPNNDNNSVLVTFSSPSRYGLRVGSSLAITGNSVYTGTYPVTQVLSNTQVVLDTSYTTTETGGTGTSSTPFPTAAVNIDLVLLSDGYQFDTPTDGIASFDPATQLGETVDFSVNQLSSIQGTVTDTNGNPLSGWVAYFDTNQNGVWDPDETAVATNSSGAYNFTNLGSTPATYTVALAPNTGAAALYTFDEVQGSSVLDTSGSKNLHTATLNNQASVGTASSFGLSEDHPNAGTNNQIVKFTTASNSFVSAMHSTDLQPGQGAFSLAGWIYVQNPGNVQSIAQSADGAPPSAGWQFLISRTGSDQKLSVILRDTSGNNMTIDGSTALQADTWYHVAFTYDGTNNSNAVTIYLNGVAESASLIGNSLPSSPDIASTTNQDLVIGSYDTQQFGGYMDDVSVWGTDLAATQIGALYLGQVIPGYLQTVPTNPNTITVPINDSNPGFDVKTGKNFTLQQLGAISGQLIGADGATQKNIGIFATSQDIGNPGVTGSASESNGTYTVVGAGTDIWNTSDQFHFVSSDLTGDGEIIARITSLTNNLTKAGVMFRAGTDANAPFVDLVMQQNTQLVFQYRDSAGASAQNVQLLSNQALPLWLRLVRKGNVFTAYYSSDGGSWTQIGDSHTSPNMPATALIGLAVTSHNTDSSVTAKFDNVSYTAFPPLAGWTVNVMQGNTVVRSTTTLADGSYVVPGLLPGSYTVEQVVPSGWQQAAPFYNNITFNSTQPATPGNGTFTSVATGNFDSAASTAGPGNVAINAMDTNPVAIINVDENNVITLPAGSYNASRFNFEFSSLNNHVATGTVQPLLLQQNANGSFVVLAMGAPVTYSGLTNSFTSVNFAGTSAFELTQSTQVYAGFYWKGTSAIGFENNTGSTFQRYGVTGTPVVGQPITNAGGSSGTFQRTYNFSVEVESQTPDLAFSSANSSQLTVLYGDGQGSFSGAQNWATGQTNPNQIVSESGLNPNISVSGVNSTDISTVPNTGEGQSSQFGAPIATNVLPSGAAPVDMLASTFTGVGIFSETRDIGSPSLAGSASESNGTYTVNAAGADIWGTSDQFHYVSSVVAGDGEIVARLTSVTNTNTNTKAGVMFRATDDPGSSFIDLYRLPGGAVQMEGRNGEGASAVLLNSISTGTNPVWLRLVRSGYLYSGYYSTDGHTWTEVGHADFQLPISTRMGLMLTSHDTSQTATATFDKVNLQSNVSQFPGVGMFAQSRDIGNPSIPGSATEANGTYTVIGSGSDIWNTSDQFHFVASTLDGDGEIVAELNSTQGSSIKAGIMFRATSDASTPFVDLVFQPENQVINFQTRAGGTESATTLAQTSAGSFPLWLRLVRTGNDFTAYHSTNGTSWTQIGSTHTAENFHSSALVGLAVTSRNTNATASATFENVTLTGNTTLTTGVEQPRQLAVAFQGSDSSSSGFALVEAPNSPALGIFSDSEDIRNPTFPFLIGYASESNGTYSVTGTGTDIWNNSDGFHFVSSSAYGDGVIIARIPSVPNGTTKAGVMFRASDSPSAPFVDLVVEESNQLHFQYRDTDGATASEVAKLSVSALPVWLRLVRSGNTFTASYSTDGNNWISVGTPHTTSMPTSARVGLAVTSRNIGATSTVSFDNVSLTGVVNGVTVTTQPGLYRANLLYSGGLATGDVNGDGIPDVVLNGGNNLNEITLGYGNGSGGFTLFAIPMPTTFANGGPVAISDVNRDGLPEIVAASSNSGDLVVLLQDQGGGFPLSTAIPLTTIGDVPAKRLLAQDFNADGAPELVALPADGTNTQVNIFVNQNGTGLSGQEWYIPTPLTFTPFPGSAATPVADLVTADVNGDSLPDLVVVADNSPHYAVMLNQATHTVESTIPVYLSAGQVSSGNDFANTMTGQVSGTVYQDTNGNGIVDGADQPHPSAIVYLDFNDNGTLDLADVQTTTDSQGAYHFSGLAEGTYRVRLAPVGGWLLRLPAGEYGSAFHEVIVTASSTSPGQDFLLTANLPPVLTPTFQNGPLVLGTTLTISASFDDPDSLDPHLATIDWGDGTTSDGVLVDLIGSGSVSGSHTYAASGIYHGTITVFDGNDEAVYGTSPFTAFIVGSLLQPLASHTIDEGASFAFTVGLTEAADGHDLTFSLDPGAPVAASIDPITGRFTWTPTGAEKAGNYTVTVRVTDSSAPTITEFMSFRVTVLATPVAYQAINPVVTGTGGSRVIQVFDASTGAFKYQVPLTGYRRRLWVSTADYNGDRVVDLYVWYRRGNRWYYDVYSGVNGSLLLRRQRGNVVSYYQDVDGNGVAELIILVNRKGKWRALQTTPT